ncbi:unnamed protein product [Cunninghamella blakesleeana]
MDIGQRPSRQRCHLPLHGKITKGTNNSDLNNNNNKRKERILPKHIKRKSDNNNNNKNTSRIDWKAWFWRCCIIWFAFLCFRILLGLTHGNISEMSLTYHISRLMSSYRFF